MNLQLEIFKKFYKNYETKNMFIDNEIKIKRDGQK